ncbi:MAG: hypothetical protein AAF467_16085 [Actinomycetota bacterium]
MFDSVFVDIAIGLAVVFFVVSSLVAALNQWVSSVLNIRAKVLWNALANLLDPAPGGTAGVASFDIPFMQSLMVFARSDRRPRLRRTLSNDASQVARTLDDLARSPIIAPLGGISRGRTTVDHIPAPMMSAALMELATKARGAEVSRYLHEAREAHARATAADNPDPEVVVTGWHEAANPGALAMALTDRGLSANLAQPIEASAAAWQAAIHRADALAGAAALNNAMLAAVERIADANESAAVADLKALTASTPVGAAVDSITTRAAAGTDAVIGELSAWFDTYMEEVRALYRKAARRILFLAGIAMAVALNINAIDLVEDLRLDSDRRTALTAAADSAAACEDDNVVTCAEQLVGELNPDAGSGEMVDDITLPVFGQYVTPYEALGLWTDDMPDDNAVQVVAGWLLTGVAVSLGAPFWFDVVQRLSGYRRSRL